MRNIIIGKEYTLEELLLIYPELSKRMEYRSIKSKVRHKEVNEFNDLDKYSKDLLLSIKKELFNNEPIYLSGSRINGTYLTESEYNEYKKKYSIVKRSDWDIRSEQKVDRKLLKDFEIKNNIKIDFSIGTFGIKI